MNKYNVELPDGRIVAVEQDHAPTEQEYHKLLTDIAEAEPPEASPLKGAIHGAIASTGEALKGGELFSRGQPVLGEMGMPVSEETQAQYEQFKGLPAAERMKEVKGGMAYKAGEAVKAYAGEIAPLSPTEQKSFWTQLAMGAGSFAPLVAASTVAPHIGGPITIALQTAGGEMDRIYEDQKKAGKTDEEAAKSAMDKAQASGLVQAALFEVAPKPLKKIGDVVVGKLAKNAIAEWGAKRLSEAAQGAVLGGASSVAADVVAERPVGVQEAIHSAASLGTLLPVTGIASSLLTRGKAKPSLVTKADEAVGASTKEARDAETQKLAMGEDLSVLEPKPNILEGVGVSEPLVGGVGEGTEIMGRSIAGGKNEPTPLIRGLVEKRFGPAEKAIEAHAEEVAKREGLPEDLNAQKAAKVFEEAYAKQEKDAKDLELLKNNPDVRYAQIWTELRGINEEWKAKLDDIRARELAGEIRHDAAVKAARTMEENWIRERDFLKARVEEALKGGQLSGPEIRPTIPKEAKAIPEPVEISNRIIDTSGKAPLAERSAFKGRAVAEDLSGFQPVEPKAPIDFGELTPREVANAPKKPSSLGGIPEIAGAVPVEVRPQIKTGRAMELERPLYDSGLKDAQGNPIMVDENGKVPGVPSNESLPSGISIKEQPRGISQAGERGAILNESGGREKFFRIFSKAFDKIQDRTTHGLRSEAPTERSMVLVWSNGGSRWIVGRSYPKDTRIDNLDANHVVVPWLPLKEANMMAQHLPPLPLYAFSFENNKLANLPEGATETQIRDALSSAAETDLTKSDKRAYFDKMMDRINAEWPAQKSGMASTSGFGSQQLGLHLASGAAGAILGAQKGETPDEKRRNMILGGLMGLAAPSLVKGAIGVSNRLKTQGKAVSEPSRAQTKQPNAIQERSATEVPLGASPGAGPEMGEGVRQPQESARAQDPITKEPIEPPQEVKGTPDVWRPFFTDFSESALAQRKDIIGKATRAFGETSTAHTIETVFQVLKNAGIVTDNIGNVSPVLKGVIQKFEKAVGDLVLEWRDKSVPAATDLRKIFGREKFEELSQALLTRTYSGDSTEVNRIASSVPGGREALAKLESQESWGGVRDDMWGKTEASQSQHAGRQEFYYPIVVAEGKIPELIKILSHNKDAKHDVDKVLAEAKREAGRDLTLEEQGNVISQYLYSTLYSGRGKPGFLKERNIKEVTKEIAPLLEPIDVAIDKRIGQVAREAKIREFFGKVDPEKADLVDLDPVSPFGLALAKERAAGKITDTGLDVVSDNIKSYFENNRGASSASWAFYRAMNNLAVLGHMADISTAVVQLSDAFSAAAMYGPKAAAKAVGSVARENIGRVTGIESMRPKEYTSLRDIGVHGGHIDTAEFMRGATPTKSFIRQPVKHVINVYRSAVKNTLGLMDAVGKEVLLNAARTRISEAARDPSRGTLIGTADSNFNKIAKKISETHPDEWPQMLETMKSEGFAKGDLDTLGKLLLYERLSEIQPISRAEQAQGKLAAHPGIKAIFALRGYMLKTMGLMRNNTYEQLKKGNIKDAALWFGTYAAWAVSGQWIIRCAIAKAFGSDCNTPDQLVGALAGLVGLNRHTIATAARQGPVSAAMEMITPPAAPITAIAEDVGLLRDALLTRRYKDGGKVVPTAQSFISQMETLKHAPYVGRELDRLFGPGSVKEKRARYEKAQGIAPQTTLGELQKIFTPGPKQRPPY